MPVCQYPALVRYLIEYTDVTEKTKTLLNEIRDFETQMIKHYRDPELFNRIIIDRLRHHLVDYLLEKFLNDVQNKTLDVEVHTERLHRTMQVLEERYRNSDKEFIHMQILKIIRYQALSYYGQQEKVDAIIKADKQPDGSEGHLSDMKHTVFYSLTEATIRAAAKVQADRLYRKRKRHNSQTATQSQSQGSPTTTTKRHKPDNGAPKQTKPIGQAQEKKGVREERACPYFNVKASNHIKQAEERVRNDLQVARLSITSGKQDSMIVEKSNTTFLKGGTTSCGKIPWGITQVAKIGTMSPYFDQKLAHPTMKIASVQTGNESAEPDRHL
ncbi:hypothetical protein SARC_05423 [Sphaeroforma arctica JP610]|uniref:Uncharacterized protein n=1 Tax=Sphaeroforma arctica JP610 TaxID=667725 RepID=A0A0L0G0B1_9EUKA|nr:hypothetical protein SARC_05423 [Sphaeroforma arctica JP610]KNC82289.1 hypothetical protein SARC_05423 [Sphaeroforma arctica JP610]|eukprot:XP_014156191.1 hypothetical protein SARC_05423 [Sphaeroforma arctica JP610]